MKKQTILLFALFLQIYNTTAQITPENPNWDELIPTFENASILEYDTLKNSEYIKLTSRIIETPEGKSFLKHELELLYGDITRVIYAIPRKYTNSFLRNYYLEFPKLGYKSEFGGQVIGFELYLKYSMYRDNTYITSFHRTKNAKMNNYNNLQDNLTHQNLQKLKDSHFLCKYNVYKKTYDNNDILVFFAHGIIKGEVYLFFIDIVSPKIKTENTFSIEKLIVELYNKDRININNILFETGKAVLAKDSKETIEIIADYLSLYSEVKLQINGHTDDVGNSANNLELSKQRAMAVVNSLIEDYNIEKTRLTANGFGEEKPIAKNDSEEGRKLNRRVELVIKD